VIKSKKHLYKNVEVIEKLIALSWKSEF